MLKAYFDEASDDVKFFLMAGWLADYRGFERDEDALEVHTQWVKHKTSHFSYRSTLL